MREIFTSGSVGGAPGNRCFYLEPDARGAGFYADYIRWFAPCAGERNRYRAELKLVVSVRVKVPVGRRVSNVFP